MASLLILPFPPTPYSRAVLEAAYRPPLVAVLKKLLQSDNKVASVLTVVVPGPFLSGPPYGEKTLVWSTAQALLAHVYSITALICAKENVEADVRVVLVDHVRGRSFDTDAMWSFRENGTAVFDLRAFAHSFYPFATLYRVNTEAGIDVFNTYLQLIESKYLLKQDQIVTVEGGLGLSVRQEVPRQSGDGETFSTVCIGGTFDHLHEGHKLLLSAGVLLLRLPRDGRAKLVIGITGDEMLKSKKFAELIEPWSARAHGVVSFLASLLDTREMRGKHIDALDVVKEETPGTLTASFRAGAVSVQCVTIQDGFGPTVTCEDMQALVVSGETRAGGTAVNAKRAEQGWHALKIYEVDVLDAREQNGGVDGEEVKEAEDYSAKISSTAIRQRWAQRSG
ncbi:hypothetical protein TD95_000166 [Thielaviopsis punctulata]|uniref:Cytidyltransferase-like domain-containing protein n=1 Tax=Thielaviopsis punctulata TaxID=72032 RepID=A0A0F4Z9B1_9PEZI|nr:hypothetical protein TD95_000166 [Thielaviopsis punctulata]